jgi:hypothetical protein
MGLVPVDQREPGDEPLPRVRVERFPQLLGRHGQGEADGRLLHHRLARALVEAPVLRVIGIRPGRQAALPESPVRELAAARGEGSQPPERTREALEFGVGLREDGGEAAEPDARATGAEVRDDRLHQIANRPLQVGATLQRIPRQRVGSREGSRVLVGRGVHPEPPASGYLPLPSSAVGDRTCLVTGERW